MTITIPQQNIKMDVPTGIDPVWYGKLQALITQVNALNGALAGLLPPGSAWRTFTPTITASAGSFTTVSATGAYQQLGKLVSFICTISITTVGTASGNIILPLPVGTLKRAFVCNGAETVLTGFAASGIGAAGGASFSVHKYDGGSLISAGSVVTVSGTYEAT